MLAGWGVWARYRVHPAGSGLQPAAKLGAALGAMLVVFWLARLSGRLVLGTRQRITARPSHLVALAVAVLCVSAFLMASPLSLQRLVARVHSLLP